MVFIAFFKRTKATPPKKEVRKAIAKEVRKQLQQEEQKSSATPQPAQTPEENESWDTAIESMLSTTEKDRLPIAHALQEKKTDKAKELLAKLIEKQQAIQGQAGKELATSYMQLTSLLNWSDANESYRLLTEAAKLDPTNMPALNQLGHIADRLGKRDQALAAYK